MMWRRRMERELERDIEEHIALDTEENIARGMSPGEARYAALRKFGNITRVKEDTRSVWLWTWLDTLYGDVRHAFRRMRRGPGTAALVVLSLTLAFVPSVTLFSVMDRMFLTPLPIRAPGEVVEILFREVRPDADRPLRSISYPEVQDFHRSLNSVAGLAYQRRQGVVALLNGRRATVWASLVSDDFFNVLGIPVQSGPGFSQDRPALIVSHSLWIREFGGRPDAIGRTLLLNGQAFTIGGVAAPGFRGTERHITTDLWIPVETWLQLQPRFRGGFGRDNREGTLWARLRPGVPLAHAAAEVERVSRELTQKWPGTNRDLVGYTYDALSDRERGGRVVTAIGVPLLGILLAVACANVAGILLARAEERRHETAVRQALGASRVRLIREWMVESIVLASLAAALGLGGARLLIHLLPSLPTPIPVNFEFSIGPRVWLYAISMVGLSALSFGLVPAWRGSRPDLLMGLRHDSAVSLLRARVPVRSLLIVAQVAAAEVLLFGAGLVLDTLSTLRRLDPGFDPHRRVAMALLLPTAEDGSQRQVDCEAVGARLAQIGGVRRVAYGRSVPLSGSLGPTLRMEAPGQEPREVLGGLAGPGFFSLLGVRILSGRDLQRFDQHAVLVNVALARLLAGPGEAVGRQIRIEGTIAEIVGVFQDRAWSSLRDPARPRVIALASARSGGEITFAVEVVGDPGDYLAPLRNELTAAQPGSTVLSSKTLRQHYEDSLWVERTATKTLYGLGLLALLLTATGLHGITTALFARRTREFAIRLAVGAAPHQIVGAVLSNGLILTGVGLVLGLAIALPGALIVGGKLPGFSPWSVSALGFSSAIVIGAALAAAVQPACRVLRIQFSRPTSFAPNEAGALPARNPILSRGQRERT